MSQVFSADSSCREVVRKFLGWLGVSEGRTASPKTSAYCQARGRLGVDTLQQVHREIAEAIEGSVESDDLWYGRGVKVVDGSSISMPDTSENQAAYPQPSCQKPGCGFPVMRIVGVFSLVTGALLGLAKGALHIGEGALFRQLWERLSPGDVVLSDCGFCSYAHVYFLTRGGVDLVMRNHQRRKVGLHLVKRFNRNERLVQWHKTKNIPNWLSKAAWLLMPDTLLLREITFSIHTPGFRTRTITVITTLLNRKVFPTRAFAELYRRRWMAELFLRDIKITMRFDILRCKSPEMIEKELWMHLIAYNLVRALMFNAAQTHRIPVERISFKGALVTIREWTPLLAADLEESQRRWMTALLLKYLASDLLPSRPNRSEPRARKRRPKNYPLLTKPRIIFMEIPHRNRYKKPLT